MTSPGFRPLASVPPVGWWALAVVAQSALGTWRWVPGGNAWRLAAAATAAASGAIGISGLELFRRADTTFHPLHPEHASALVTTGVYAKTRNPMYVALAGALVAHAMWKRNPVALLPVCGFVGALEHGQIAWEETALRQRFGDAWAQYCNTTPRWL